MTLILLFSTLSRVIDEQLASNRFANQRLSGPGVLHPPHLTSAPKESCDAIHSMLG